ncbi:transporter substrate-binding domain-containing protein [Paucibacter sp. APW11]|uniref:Transporter substrate-binding domain-containing protein n=1 Tax=Roseateles aquae TaxID=3077235 RepID=A0ABU3PJ46_9BURK|nr:transporter substrate-binding domain-containing protein [Paucibacter sp. APW11]MDT9002412.1 transporter substrate-binding domain-containing protein [Paucibacter sp. APW11]
MFFPLCGLRCLLALMLAWSTAAAAQELKVAMIQLDPWTIKNPDANSPVQYVGIVPDLLDELERRSSFKTRRTLTPYARVELDLENGMVDFAIMAWGEIRARYADKGVTLVQLEFGVRARKGVPIKRYEDLREIITSATRGLRIDPRFDVDETVRKDYVLDYSTGIRKTVAGHDSQAVAGSLSTINAIIRKNRLEEQFGDTLLLRTVPLTAAFSKRGVGYAQANAVGAVFKAMVEDGTAQRIYDSWMNRP